MQMQDQEMQEMVMVTLTVMMEQEIRRLQELGNFPDATSLQCRAFQNLWGVLQELAEILEHFDTEGINQAEAGQEGGAPPMTPTAIEVPSHSFTLSAFHFPQSSVQALETKVVAEENTGNCPVCVDPFQIGDQV